MALRILQARNLFCLLMLANGTPMFAAGDEFLNTQGDNNNPYNQDNETTWLDWDLLTRNADFFRFAQAMIAFRKAHPSLGRSRFWRADVTWLGAVGGNGPRFQPAGLSPERHRRGRQRPLYHDQRRGAGRGLHHSDGGLLALRRGHEPRPSRRHGFRLRYPILRRRPSRADAIPLDQGAGTRSRGSSYCPSIKLIRTCRH